MNTGYESRIAETVTQLRALDPDRVYLFGSLAKGGPAGNGEDIDIAVVLDVRTEPSTFEQRLELKVAVRNTVFEISKEVPIDLVVYTKREFEKLAAENTPFIREVLKGDLLYEEAG